MKNKDKYLSRDAKLAYASLLMELQAQGPHRSNWANFTKMNGKEDYHCHIIRGRPTYVACWRVNKAAKIIEVFYVGTHEKADY